MLSFPPHCSASLPGQGVWSRTWQEVFVTRCTEGESKQWDAQTQEVLPSSCRLQLGVFHSALHDQKEETWATSLPTHVFLRVFRSPPSHLIEVFSPLSVISTLALCSSTECLNTGVSLCLLHCIYKASECDSYQLLFLKKTWKCMNLVCMYMCLVFARNFNNAHKFLIMLLLWICSEQLTLPYYSLLPSIEVRPSVKLVYQCQSYLI